MHYQPRCEFLVLKMYPKYYLYKRIKDAKILIDRKFTGEIDLTLISKQVYLSKYHFLRLFKEAYDTSPHQYVIQKRIALAKEKLTQGYSVSETCNSIGFESIPSFSSLFKRNVGVTPSEYRRNQLKVNSNFR